jgi:CRISPR/Cas system CSM-associated protein Csm2 small subunit|tara:strand:+ start:3858 stop:4145 length:288 start_codon:yes stop_codon:yes gene_type:complete
MDIINILETFGIPVAMSVAFGFFIWKQNKFIQDELTKELRESFKRLEDIIIGLINAQKKLQTDFGRELARLEGSYRSLSNMINKLLEKDRKRDNK